MKKILILMFTLILTLTTVGCSQQGTAAQTKEEKIDAFFAEMYAINKDDRFTKYMEAFPSISSETTAEEMEEINAKLEEIAKEYTKEFSNSMCTEKCISLLLANRLIPDDEYLNRKEGITPEIISVEKEETSEGVYDVTVEISDKDKDGNQVERYKIKGQIGFEGDLIDNYVELNYEKVE